MRIRRGGTAQRITSAHEGHSVSLATRERRYIISMAIRTVCFILAYVARDSWLMWVFVAGALLLPYFAVMAANIGDNADPDPLPPVHDRELEGHDE